MSSSLSTQEGSISLSTHLVSCLISIVDSIAMILLALSFFSWCISLANWNSFSDNSNCWPSCYQAQPSGQTCRLLSSHWPPQKGWMDCQTSRGASPGHSSEATLCPTCPHPWHDWNFTGLTNLAENALTIIVAGTLSSWSVETYKKQSPLCKCGFFCHPQIHLSTSLWTIVQKLP